MTNVLREDWQNHVACSQPARVENQNTLGRALRSNTEVAKAASHTTTSATRAVTNKSRNTTPDPDKSLPLGLLKAYGKLLSDHELLYSEERVHAQPQSLVAALQDMHSRPFPSNSPTEIRKVINLAVIPPRQEIQEILKRVEFVALSRFKNATNMWSSGEQLLEHFFQKGFLGREGQFYVKSNLRTLKERGSSSDYAAGVDKLCFIASVAHMNEDFGETLKACLRTMDCCYDQNYYYSISYLWLPAIIATLSNVDYLSEKDLLQVACSMIRLETLHSVYRQEFGINEFNPPGAALNFAECRLQDSLGLPCDYLGPLEERLGSPPTDRILHLTLSQLAKIDMNSVVTFLSTWGPWLNARVKFTGCDIKTINFQKNIRLEELKRDGDDPTSVFYCTRSAEYQDELKRIEIRASKMRDYTHVKDTVIRLLAITTLHENFDQFADFAGNLYDILENNTWTQPSPDVHTESLISAAIPTLSIAPKNDIDVNLYALHLKTKLKLLFDGLRLSAGQYGVTKRSNLATGLKTAGAAVSMAMPPVGVGLQIAGESVQLRKDKVKTDRSYALLVSLSHFEGNDFELFFTGVSERLMDIAKNRLTDSELDAKCSLVDGMRLHSLNHSSNTQGSLTKRFSSMSGKASSNPLNTKSRPITSGSEQVLADCHRRLIKQRLLKSSFSEIASAENLIDAVVKDLFIKATS